MPHSLIGRAAGPESRPESESIVFPGVGVRAGVGMVFRLRNRVAGYKRSTGNDFGQTVMHRHENIERQEEKKCGSVDMKLKRHLVIEFSLIQGALRIEVSNMFGH